MSEPVLTAANQLTLLRMALVPALVVSALQGEFVWALVAFTVAGLTDLLDGFIARHGSQPTTLGAFLDPVADKLLLSASFIVLTWGAPVTVRIPVWLTVTALSRDAIILLAAAIINMTVGRRVFTPSMLGKLSTAAQVATAGSVLLANALQDAFGWLPILYWLALGLTVGSAFDYTWRASGGRRAPEAGKQA
jgi:cardiolipin synthase